LGKTLPMGEGGLRLGSGRMATRVVGNGRLGGLGGPGFRVKVGQEQVWKEVVARRLLRGGSR
jgi:hypothetical protein